MARKPNTSPLWRFAFLVYCAVMLWLLFGRSQGFVAGVPYETQLRQNANLIPFYTIENYWNILNRSDNQALRVHCFINLAGNLFLFVPAGWLLPRLWKKMRNFFRFFALCFGLIFFVEVIQLFTLLGSFDVDDVILNLIGMTFGFAIYTARAAKSK